MNMAETSDIFPKIIGHSAQLENLMLLLNGGTIPHALLFSGPCGVGKRTIALEFATALLTKNVSTSASGKSRTLIEPEEVQKLISTGMHPDLHFLCREQGKKDLTVEAVRQLRTDMQLKPYYGGCSVAIIDNAHEMNIAASNALLMTLEEPPGESYLILVTDSPQRLPETIVSRCQLIHFGELSEEEIRQILQQRLSSVIEDSKLLKNLAVLAGTTLSPLALTSYIDPRTSEITDEDGLRDYLDQLISRSQIIREQVKHILAMESEDPNLSSSAVSLAAHFASEKEHLPLVWHVMQSEIRSRLRSADSKEHSAWAELLLDSLRTEQLIRERNVNPQLQLSSLLMR